MSTVPDQPSPTAAPLVPVPVVVRADSVAPQAWRNGGGQTRELLAWPDAADWRLRISRADIDSAGAFSAFAGVQRWFVVLCGQGVVLRMPSADGQTLDHHLAPGHPPLHFDGGLAPFCQLEDGPTQDLNLMARGGKACMLAVEDPAAWLPVHSMCGLYTVHPGRWSADRQTLALPAHSLLWLPQGCASAMHFTPEGALPLRAWWLGYTPEQHP